MRQWFAVGSLIVACLASAAFVSFVRLKQQDKHYRTTLAEFRSALKAGTTRAEVEEYLRKKSMPYERTCCQPGIFFDRATVGKRVPKFFCTNESIYLEFKFDNQSRRTDVATGSDVLEKIDLAEEGLCL